VDDSNRNEPIKRALNKLVTLNIRALNRSEPGWYIVRYSIASLQHDFTSPMATIHATAAPTPSVVFLLSAVAVISSIIVSEKA
jgi:hypothetical protein